MTIEYAGTAFGYCYKDLVLLTPQNAHGYSCVTIEQPGTVSGGVSLQVGTIISFDSATNKYLPAIAADIASNKVFGVVLDTMNVHATEFKTTRVAKAGTSGFWVLSFDVINAAFATAMVAADRNALIAHLETKNIRIVRG